MRGTVSSRLPVGVMDTIGHRNREQLRMRVEQLFVETLIDINKKLGSNPSDYHLLRVSGLLRQILLDKKNLLEPASAAASLEAKFRVVKPGPPPIPPDAQRQIDDAWDNRRAVSPSEPLSRFFRLSNPSPFATKQSIADRMPT
jgi:hypothetical protein